MMEQWLPSADTTLSSDCDAARKEEAHMKPSEIAIIILILMQAGVKILKFLEKWKHTT